MIFLIGSIIFTTFLAIALKLCERMGINTFQAIIFNYLTCIITGVIINGVFPAIPDISTPWLPWALLMGLFFIIFFNLTALTVKKNGVAVTSVATKLSLVIPFLFSIFLYKEETGVIKVAGIALALVAVVLTCASSKGNGKKKAFDTSNIILPAVLFLGTGLLDTIIKYTEQKFIDPASRNVFLITCFLVAFVTGSLYYILQLVNKKMRFEPRAIIAGTCIGVPNYLSIWCLVIALKEFSSNSSVVIPVNNIAIVLISALIAWLFFRERLTRVNWIGIVLAVLSILMVTSDL